MDNVLSDEHRQAILDILHKEVPTAEVYLFGSRASGTARRASDADIALRSDAPISPTSMARLISMFSESNLPFFVDIVDLRATSDEFRQEIERNAIRLA
jgi:predicted nucleotidyltransferase